MTDIVEPLRSVRVVAEPRKLTPLRTFSCGRKGNEWETFVNDWARCTYLGSEDRSQTVLVMEDAIGRLIGVCSLKPDPLPIAAGRLMANTRRIHVVGINRLFRGKRLQDGSRPGDALLCGALEHIERVCKGKMPYVWALVSPRNDHSAALFDRHGFRALPYEGEGEIIRVRPPSEHLPVLTFKAPQAGRALARRLGLGKAKRERPG